MDSAYQEKDLVPQPLHIQKGYDLVSLLRRLGRKKLEVQELDLVLGPFDREKTLRR